MTSHNTKTFSSATSVPLREILQVAVIGDFLRKDFLNIVRDIREKTAVICFDNLTLFLQVNRVGQCYDLIFLLASGFSQYSLQMIQQLQDRWPFVRIVMIAGSLAEGERRTGTLPPGLIRYYWHQWETEVLPDFTSFCNRRSSAWGLPPAASDEERLLAIVTNNEKSQHQSIKPQPKAVMVVADDPAMRDLLVDWTTQKGYLAKILHRTDFKSIPEIEDVMEIFFDVTTEDFAETLAIIQFLKRHQPSPAHFTVFYTSPRVDEIRQLTLAGADRVVTKPFFLA